MYAVPSLPSCTRELEELVELVECLAMECPEVSLEVKVHLSMEENLQDLPSRKWIK